MEIFTEGWQWVNEQMINFWWQSRSLSGYRDSFPDSSLLGDMESGINRLRCAMLQCRACTIRHRHSNNYHIITSLAQDRQPQQTCLGRGMHCPSASSYFARRSSGKVLWGARLSVRLSVCLCVSLSASISPEPHERSLPIFRACCLMAVARSSSGRVTKSQGKGAILGVFLRNDNAL